jgi:aryl-alcohol dehydrogenase-like predicted oxidoreductase
LGHAEKVVGRALAEDDFRRTHPFAELDTAPVREELRARGGGSVTRGALDFTLSHPAVTGAIVGIRNEREGRELAAVS